jgi:hypothetical protein
VLGAQRSPYLEPGKWQLDATFRWLDSDRHFAGTEEQVERHELGNFVINRQRLLDLSPTYALTRQTNLSLSVPFLAYGSWSIPKPIRPVPGPRETQSTSGLGDLSLVARHWMFNTARHERGNVSLGAGLKFPTGNYRATDEFTNLVGDLRRRKPVDQSIQPGDGGLGVVLDLQGFQHVGSAVFFASGSYLINPRNTNGTPSIIATLFDGLEVPDHLAHLTVNSVPDQYIARAGVGVPVPRITGLAVTLAARIEGVPPKDLIGRSEGFRRPGYAIFVEPGLIYTRGRDTFSLSAPVATQRNRQADFSGFEGDATFADYFFVFSYSRRL